MAEIVHDAVGDDAEIIFGATIDASLQGEVRATVIATGFDRAVTGEAPFAPGRPQPGVLPFPAPKRPAAPAQAPQSTGVPRQPVQPRAQPAVDIPDMEIPTFIRRQMD